MKLITVEEHFESAAVTAAMRQAVGNAVLPAVSPALRQYMRDNLPSPAIMQDTQHERLAFMAQYGIDMQVLSYGNSSPQNLSPEQAVPLYDLSFIQSSFQFLFIFFHSVISYTNRAYSYVDYLQHSSFRTDRLIPSPIFKIAVSSRSSCFNSYRYSRILA